MRRPLKRAAPHVAGFAWLASSVCAAAPGTAAAVPMANPAAPATAASADAQRQLDTARMWGAKHRDDLARDARRKGLLIAPGDPELLAEQVRSRGASLLMVTHSAQAERIADRVLRLTPEGVVAA